MSTSSPTFFRLHFVFFEDLLGRIRRAKLVRPFGGLCLYARFGLRPLISSFPVGPYFVFLGSTPPVAVGSWILLRREHHRAGEEEDCFVGYCAAGSTHLLP